ncbi:hypothetical protein ACFW04_009934 [Cataglyphis niger]
MQIVIFLLIEQYYFLQFTIELNKYNSWEEKLEFAVSYFSEEKDGVLSIENQKHLCLTFYDHIIALQNYNITSLPRLKSSIILLKPTFTSFTFVEEDYGLRKITENEVEIHYVEGTHITMMENDKIASIINEAL